MEDKLLKCKKNFGFNVSDKKDDRYHVRSGESSSK